VNTRAANPSQARLDVMKVEVALLGDAQTYQQAIEVRLDQDAILLCGEVQDEQSRKRALEIARQNCYLPVKDALTVVARTIPRSARPVSLEKSARDALVRQLGSKADRLRVVPREDGQITLQGEANSFEEKRAASRALRGLVGCRRVINNLTVRSVEQAGHSITMVSSDGQDVVCTPLASREPEERVVKKVAGEEIKAPLPQVETTSTIEQTHPERLTATLPSGLPGTRLVSVSSGTKGKDEHKVMYVVPTSSGYATTAPEATRAIPLNSGGIVSKYSASGKEMESEKPALWERLFAWKYARAARRTPIVPQPMKAAQPAETVKLPTMPGREAPAKLPEPEVKPATVALPEPKPQPTPETREPVAVAKEEAWPPAHDVRPVKPRPRGEVYQSRPLAGLKTKVVPATVKTSTPEKAKTEVKPVSTKPVSPKTEVKPVSTKTITEPAQAPVVVKADKPVEIKTEPKPTPSATPVAIRLTAKELSERVHGACGKLARRVRIEPGKDKAIHVHVHANPGVEQHVLVGKLLQMPELAASNVQLHVHLPE
jgi:osmotically-inducible protein OsmY